MTKNILFVFSAILAVATSNVAHADIYGDLTDEQKELINGGEQAEDLVDVAGSAWPSVTVYQIVPASPDQVAAVMFDYPLHKDMFEGITKSEASAAGTPNTDIAYTMKLPTVLGVSLPEENYTVNNILTKMGDKGYSIDWTLIKASSMQDCYGSVKFEPNGTGTLVAYTNFINPPKKYGNLAKLIKGMAVARVHDTVKALGKQTEAELAAAGRAQLTAQLANLNKALGQ